MNEMLREAMVGAIHEIAASSDTETLVMFISAIKTIREELVLTYMTDEYIKLHVWPLMRTNVNLIKSILHATANFSMAIDDLPAAIKSFSGKAICFTQKSAIVDDDLMGKSISQTELETILINNNWLFFILFCTTQIYLMNQVGLQYVPVKSNA